MKVTIVGIKKGKTKKGQYCWNYYGVKDFTEYDQSNSECSGQEVIDAFAYKDYGVQVGDLVNFLYEPGFQGKASLSDIIMVKPSSGIPFDEKKEKPSGK